MTTFRFLNVVLLAASTALSAQTYTVLHNFGEDTSNVTGNIAQSRGGAMLTTSFNTAFRIWTGGSLEVLHQFLNNSELAGGLILAGDGKFYSTTEQGGQVNWGTVFKMSQDGSVTTLHEFTGGSDGAGPVAAPIQSVEGDFYGTTSLGGGLNRYGTVYRITKYGKFTLLHTFSPSDGESPQGQLVQGTNYYFYGTAENGGKYGYGTIFRISRSGDFKVLVNFNGTTGSFPNARLIQANDGNFYGVVPMGGSSNGGVLFRMKPDGTLTVLHNFTGGSDGSGPQGGLVQASDGNLYGTNQFGGKNGNGVLFRATLAGDVVPLHNFADSSGNYPYCALLQHTNGKLYGDTTGGGTLGYGVFFRFNAGLRPFVTYLPTYGRPGALVQILGQGFTDSSEVRFNGILATDQVVYPTYIRAIVPDGATTGPITVTTSGGTLTSNKVLIVHPH